jgi:uncharacterized protein YfaP (DUF2135 family)
MKNKLLILLCILTVLISLSVVSAADNQTDSNLKVVEQVDEDVLTDGDVKAPSEITASNVKGYESFPISINGKISSNGTPLADKKINAEVNGSKFEGISDKDGIFSIPINLTKGSYKVNLIFAGDNQTQNASATCKVKIKEAVATQIKVGDKYLNYRQGSECLFYVTLLKADGTPVKHQNVTFKIAGKRYNATTNKNGNAKIFLKLKKGKYKIKYKFAKNSPYNASSGSYKIKVRSAMGKGNGYWLWPSHMKQINLKSLASKGTKHLFLHAEALSVHGKSAVTSFINSAHKNGIKVHLWMNVFYNGGKWVSPVTKTGKFKTSFMNKKIAQAKSYAKIPGVDGVHFDYIRYGGTAHKHINAVESINYFVKKASTAVHKVKSNCIVSAAVMPEPKMMHYYYGQDIPTMSRYLDCILPMVYRYNYHKEPRWIHLVTEKFGSQSLGAQIWTGIQSYSNGGQTILSQSTLVNDARAAIVGGADGVVLFRIGISCNFIFKAI